jgi:hypothetical protein
MVKKEFKIVTTEAGPEESIILGLVPIYSSQSSEEKRLDPTKVLAGPAVQSEDTKIISEGVRAVMDELKRQGMFPPSGQAMAFIPILHLPLTKEEYEQLGNPHPHEIVTLALTLERELKSEEEPKQNE